MTNKAAVNNHGDESCQRRAHTHTHACTRTHARTYTRTHACTCTYAHTHVLAHAHTHAHTCLHMHTRLHTRTHAHTLTHMCLHTHARACTRMHARACTRTHAAPRQLPSAHAAGFLPGQDFRQRKNTPGCHATPQADVPPVNAACTPTRGRMSRRSPAFRPAGLVIKSDAQCCLRWVNGNCFSELHS